MNQIIEYQNKDIERAKTQWAEVCSDDILEKIVMRAYLHVFEESNYTKAPRIGKIYSQCVYDIDSNAYDICFGVNEYMITEEIISAILSRNNSIHRYFGETKCDCQQILYSVLLPRKEGLDV